MLMLMLMFVPEQTRGYGPAVGAAPRQLEVRSKEGPLEV